MNIYLGGSRAFLAGEYTQARLHHRPSASTWAWLRDATTAEIDHTVECEAAVEQAMSEITTTELYAAHVRAILATRHAIMVETVLLFALAVMTGTGLAILLQWMGLA